MKICDSIKRWFCGFCKNNKEDVVNKVPQINYVLRNQIEGFKDISDDLLSKIKNSEEVDDFTKYTFTYVVNACFCCELILKNYFDEKGTYYRKIHDIKKLFNKLEPIKQNKIKKCLFNTNSDLSDTQETEFTQNMTLIRNGFEKFRYAFEDTSEYEFDPSTGERHTKDLKVNLDFLNKFLHCISKHLS